MFYRVVPVLAVLALAGCPSAPPAVPTASTSQDASAASPATGAAAPATGAALPATKPSASPGVKPSGSPTASPTPKPTATPKATPTPAPSPKVYTATPFFFKYPANWTVAREEKDPILVELTPPDGNGYFRVKEVQTFGTLDSEHQAIKTDAGKGIVSDTTTKLNVLSGFTLVANVDTANGSRFTTIRGYVYRGSFWRIESQWDAKGANATQIGKDVDSIIASWLWQ